MENDEDRATLAGGCFWCLEAAYEKVRGVGGVMSGYTGGHVPDPSYEQVCTGQTGHAEVVQISFDPDIVSYRDLLFVFFTIHDPTTLNRQGGDVGTQYRSAIYYHSDSQKQDALAVMADIEARRLWPGPFVTELEPLDVFFQAEDYHKSYYSRNPEAGYCRIVIEPKLVKLRKEHQALLDS